MSTPEREAQPVAQAGWPSQAVGVGAEVGGVPSSAEAEWRQLWALNPETRSRLATAPRDAACPQVARRREGAGDGPPGITTPEKLRHLQRTL